MYNTSVDEKTFATLTLAKEYVDSLPYWSEAISKDGLTQTIFDANYFSICQRSAHVGGIGTNRTVTMSDWYKL